MQGLEFVFDCCQSIGGELLHHRAALAVVLRRELREKRADFLRVGQRALLKRKAVTLEPCKEGDLGAVVGLYLVPEAGVVGGGEVALEVFAELRRVFRSGDGVGGLPDELGVEHRVVRDAGEGAKGARVELVAPIQHGLLFLAGGVRSRAGGEFGNPRLTFLAKPREAGIHLLAVARCRVALLPVVDEVFVSERRSAGDGALEVVVHVVRVLALVAGIVAVGEGPVHETVRDVGECGADEKARRAADRPA